MKNKWQKFVEGEIALRVERNDYWEFAVNCENCNIMYRGGGVGLTHKEAARNFYESLEGLKEKKDELSIDEYDEIHKTLMDLYNKLEVKIKRIAKEEE